MHNPRIHQSFANDKDRRDQNHDRITEARQGFMRREHAGKHEREHDENGHNVNARTSPRKQHNGAAQYAENHQHRACHGRLPVAEAACSFAWIGAPRLRVGAPCTAPELTHLGSLRQNRCHGENRPTTYCRSPFC